MKIKNIFITGISSGIGQGLALHFAKEDVQVFGISRRKLDYNHPNINHLTLDINDYSNVPKLKDFLPPNLGLIILNAGVLGEMTTMKNASIESLQNVMQTNLWAQKNLLDNLLGHKEIEKIITLSSGASINANVGWAGYSLSKAALNILTQLYAKEYPETHFIALAPGLVDTAMQDYIFNEVSSQEFPSVQRLKDARGTKNMPSPQIFCKYFENSLEKIFTHDSGSFVDIRKI